MSNTRVTNANAYSRQDEVFGASFVEYIQPFARVEMRTSEVGNEVIIDDILNTSLVTVVICTDSDLKTDRPISLQMVSPGGIARV